MSKAPVIAYVSPKGGAGKTTAALTLASEMVQSGRPITIIDADPNYPFKRWSAMGRKPELLNIIFDRDEETILDNIEKAQQTSAAVIVDLEGTKNQRVTYAVSRADLVVIPLQGSMLDANEAVEAVKLIKHVEKVFNKQKIPFVLLFTRMPSALQTRNFSDIARQFTDAGLPTLETRLMEREAFKTMFATGRILHDLSAKDVGGLEKAREDAFAYAQAIVSRIHQGRQKAAAA